MDLQITISGGDQALPQLTDLYRWLVADNDVADTTEVSLMAASRNDHMGGSFDVINLVLTHAESLANVLLAYATWRRSRPNVPPVTFKSERVSVSVSDGSPETIRRVIDELQEISQREPREPQDGR